MTNKAPIHVDHYSGSITEWYLDSTQTTVREVKTLRHNRSKEYVHTVERFLNEARNRTVCKKLKALVH